MRYTKLLAFCCAWLFLGCEANRPVQDKSGVRFELRGLANRANPVLYGTSYMHEGTVVAVGAPDVNRRNYEVLFAVRRISGGDPDIQRANPDYVSVYVINGIGKFESYAGMRSKPLREDQHSETWLPEKIEVQAIGYQEIRAVESRAVSD